MFLNPKSFKICQKFTTNITIKDVQQQVDVLIASAKLKNTPTSQGLDSFYIKGKSITVQVDLTI